jgi:RHS repeat-associated protein
MDSLLYQYYYYDAVGTRKTYDPTLPLPSDASRLTNQLAQVNDRVTSPYTQDLKNQGANNYTYDAIGNLLSDASEGITSIGWNVYGKILSITKGASTISYTYDAAGNRISKTSGGKTTLYVRDAGGNVLSVYEAATSSNVYQQTERHLYGSSRLGIAIGQAVAPTGILLATGDSAYVRTFVRGEKNFELSNHLGNVLATITDKKIQHDGGSGTVDYYTTDVATAQDYYPFGMLMPGRSYSSGAYRYGFNGKENDNEVKGTGNQQDYGLRIYDPRLGKFLSVDPLTKGYPMLTPYQFASNNPIAGIDVDGGEFKYYTLKWQPQADGKSHLSVVKQVSQLNKSFITSIIATGINHPTVIVPATKYTPPIFGSSNKFTFEVNFSMKDLGMSPTVASPDGKIWKVLPSYMDLDDLPALNDPIWNTFETPEQYTERLIADANKALIGVKTVALAMSMLHGATKNGKLGATKNGKLGATKNGNLLETHQLNRKDLLDAGDVLDRNNLTKAGRALQKHGDRPGSVFPKVSAKEYNEAGKEILDGILSSDNQLIKSAEKGGKVIFDQNTGRGAAFTKDNLFNGFRELHL